MTEENPHKWETQIVVQWIDDSEIPQDEKDEPLDLLRTLTDNFALELALENQSNNLYWVDGNDIGSGTYNVFLFSKQPDAAVRRVIEIFETGQLRPGMRIGVAEYTNAERTDWTYRAVYPPDLEEFKPF